MEDTTQNNRSHTTKLAKGFLHMVVEVCRQPQAGILRIGESRLKSVMALINRIIRKKHNNSKYSTIRVGRLQGCIGNE